MDISVIQQLSTDDSMKGNGSLTTPEAFKSPMTSQLSPTALQESIARILDSSSSSSAPSSDDRERYNNFEKNELGKNDHIQSFYQLSLLTIVSRRSAQVKVADDSIAVFQKKLFKDPSETDMDTDVPANNTSVEVNKAEPEKDKSERSLLSDDSVQEVKQADSIVTLFLHRKKVHHQEPDSPCTLEMSTLRLSNPDDSIISDSNLSDVCKVEEYGFNSNRPTEKILDQLEETGNPHELSLEDKDLERLLDGDSDTSLPHASTPTGSPRRSSESSYPDSMPSLVSVTPPRDSGNSSNDSDDSAGAHVNPDDPAPNQEAVKRNFEIYTFS